MLVMEERERAIRRGAEIYAEVIGYGATCDASPPGADHAQRESRRAMTVALEDAGIGPDRIQYINLHGTSTPLNDKTETAAIKLAFDRLARGLATSATKSLIGHPQGASGAAGLVATLMAVNDSFIHPTINYEHPDPECDLDYVPNTGRVKAVDYAMCNTIAFGSKNAALVLRRDEASSR